jgi:hypothetical protein
MATKQHKTYCDPCGVATNHVTSYGSPEDGNGTSVISVKCAEHSDVLS